MKMAQVEEVLKDKYGFMYDVLFSYETGYRILYQAKDSTPYPWIILSPDGYMRRYKNKAELINAYKEILKEG